MQVNKRDIADKIINDIGRQRSIERLRVINADYLQEFMGVVEVHLFHADAIDAQQIHHLKQLTTESRLQMFFMHMHHRKARVGLDSRKDRVVASQFIRHRSGYSFSRFACCSFVVWAS